MKKVTNTEARKADHIRINLEEQVASSLTTRLEEYRFIHQALPEIDLVDVDLSVNSFRQNRQSSPLFISSMTGGTKEAARINQNLARAAQQAGIAMGIGSQRAALEDPRLAATFQVRQFAPDILLFANIGAVQLNYGFGVDGCQQAIDMIEADALILHLNALQEALQPEGDANFKGLLHKIEAVARKLSNRSSSRKSAGEFQRKQPTSSTMPEFPLLMLLVQVAHPGHRWRCTAQRPLPRPG